MGFRVQASGFGELPTGLGLTCKGLVAPLLQALDLLSPRHFWVHYLGGLLFNPVLQNSVTLQTYVHGARNLSVTRCVKEGGCRSFSLLPVLCYSRA